MLLLNLYCLVGYCFGAQYTLRLGATDFLEASKLYHGCWFANQILTRVV